MISVKITKEWICFARSFLLFRWWLLRPQLIPGYRRTSSLSWRFSDLRCKLLHVMYLRTLGQWLPELLHVRITCGALTPPPHPTPMPKLYPMAAKSECLGLRASSFLKIPKWLQCAAEFGNQSPRAFLHLLKLKLHFSTYFGSRDKLHTIPIIPGIVPAINKFLLI